MNTVLQPDYRSRMTSDVNPQTKDSKNGFHAHRSVGTGSKSANNMLLYAQFGTQRFMIDI